MPAGAVYWTAEEGIWSPVSVCSDGQGKLAEKNQQLILVRNKVLQLIDPHVRPYLTAVTSSKWLQIPDPRNYWNCGLKMTFRKMADLDVGAQLKRLSHVVSDQMSGIGTEEKKSGQGKE